MRSSGLLSPELGIQLIVKGLSQSGFLLAEDDSGYQHELTPDGNSLDMMRNLIKRKV
jgi:biotin--protein ligase